jgi:hypothetical protein
MKMNKLNEAVSRTIADASPRDRLDAAELKLALLQLSEALLKLEIACSLASCGPKLQTKKIDTFTELEIALKKGVN